MKIFVWCCLETKIFVRCCLENFQTKDICSLLFENKDVCPLLFGKLLKYFSKLGHIQIIVWAKFKIPLPPDRSLHQTRTSGRSSPFYPGFTHSASRLVSLSFCHFLIFIFKVQCSGRGGGAGVGYQWSTEWRGGIVGLARDENPPSGLLLCGFDFFIIKILANLSNTATLG